MNEFIIKYKETVTGTICQSVVICPEDYLDCNDIGELIKNLIDELHEVYGCGDLHLYDFEVDEYESTIYQYQEFLEEWKRLKQELNNE